MLHMLGDVIESEVLKTLIHMGATNYCHTKVKQPRKSTHRTPKTLIFNLNVKWMRERESRFY
jgi:hypothetical protein